MMEDKVPRGGRKRYHICSEGRSRHRNTATCCSSSQRWGNTHYCVFSVEAHGNCHGMPWDPPRDPTAARVVSHMRPWMPMAVAMGAHGRPRDATGRSWDTMAATTVGCTVCNPAGSRGCSRSNTQGAAHVATHGSPWYPIAAHMAKRPW